MSKKAYLLRGWGGYAIWFRKEKKLLENLGYKVIIPKLPTKYFPFYFLWDRYLNKYSFNKDDVVIGKSLGGTLFLHYLIKNDIKIDTIFLIGVPVGGKFTNFYDKFNFLNLVRWLKINLFLWLFGYITIYDWEKIKKSAKNIHVIRKDKDFLVPKEQCKFLSKILETNLVTCKGDDHCNIIDLNLINRELV